MKAYTFSGEAGADPVEVPISESERVRADEAHKTLVERVTELDDQLLTAYLDGHSPNAVELKAALRRGTIANKGVPVVCGSALKNKGMQFLLNAVVDYLPSPLDLPPVKALKMDGTPVVRPALPPT